MRRLPAGKEKTIPGKYSVKMNGHHIVKNDLEHDVIRQEIYSERKTR